MIAIIPPKGMISVCPYGRMENTMRMKSKPLRDKIMVIVNDLKKASVMQVIGKLDNEKQPFSVSGVYKAIEGMIADGLILEHGKPNLSEEDILTMLDDCMSNDLSRIAKVGKVKSATYTVTPKATLILKLRELATAFVQENPKMQSRWVAATKSIEQDLLAFEARQKHPKNATRV